MVAQVVLGVLVTFLFCPLHETVHRTAFATGWINEALGWVVGFVVFLPHIWFRSFHFEHHRQTQVAGKDPELAKPKPASKAAFPVLSHRRDVVLVARAAHPRHPCPGAGSTTASFADARTRIRCVRQARIYLGGYLAIAAAAIWSGTWAPLVYWIVPMALAAWSLRLYLLAEHTLLPHTADMLNNTRTMRSNAPMRWLAWQMPYHTEHHLFPSVPFFRLATAFERVRPRHGHAIAGYIAFAGQYWARPGSTAGRPGREATLTFRVVTGQFMHETNTFASKSTGIDAFERMICCRGEDEIVSRLGAANIETAGYIDAAREHGWDLVFTTAAAANPLGVVTDEAFEHFAGLIVDGIRDAGEIDGVALALHGAMVTESHEDAETELVRRIRAVAGNAVPICCTFDLHANVGPRFAPMVQIACSYLTYPHVDMRTRAKRAGDLLQRAMAGEIAPRIAYARRPMLQGADGGRTDVEPMIGLRRRAEAFMAADPRVLDVSINAGFSQSRYPRRGSLGSGHRRRRGPCVPGNRRIADGRHLGKPRRRQQPVSDRGRGGRIARGFNGAGKPLVIADYADNPGGWRLWRRHQSSQGHAGCRAREGLFRSAVRPRCRRRSDGRGASGRG